MTSAVVRANEAYFRLLLETEKQQAKLLLFNATKYQVNALSEISHNLLNCDVPTKVRRLVNKIKTGLKRLAKASVSIKSKLRLLKKHADVLIKILTLIKETIMLLL